LEGGPEPGREDGVRDAPTDGLVLTVRLPCEAEERRGLFGLVDEAVVFEARRVPVVQPREHRVLVALAEAAKRDLRRAVFRPDRPVARGIVGPGGRPGPLRDRPELSGTRPAGSPPGGHLVVDHHVPRGLGCLPVGLVVDHRRQVLVRYRAGRRRRTEIPRRILHRRERIEDQVRPLLGLGEQERGGRTGPLLEWVRIRDPLARPGDPVAVVPPRHHAVGARRVVEVTVVRGCGEFVVRESRSPGVRGVVPHPGEFLLPGDVGPGEGVGLFPVGFVGAAVARRVPRDDVARGDQDDQERDAEDLVGFDVPKRLDLPEFEDARGPPDRERRQQGDVHGEVVPKADHREVRRHGAETPEHEQEFRRPVALDNPREEDGKPGRGEIEGVPEGHLGVAATGRLDLTHGAGLLGRRGSVTVHPHEQALEEVRRPREDEKRHEENGHDDATDDGGVVPALVLPLVGVFGDTVQEDRPAADTEEDQGLQQGETGRGEAVVLRVRERQDACGEHRRRRRDREVLRGAAVQVVPDDLEQDEHADGEHEGHAGGPGHQVGRDRHPAEEGGDERPSEDDPVAVPDVRDGRLLGVSSPHRVYEPGEGERSEERLRGLVVGGPDRGSGEELARKQREQYRGQQTAPSVGRPLADQIRRDRGECAEGDGGVGDDGVDGFRRGRPAADDQGGEGDQLVEQAAKAGVSPRSVREVRPRVEPLCRGEVIDDEMDDPGVVPGVVARQVDQALAPEHVRPVDGPDPGHERDHESEAGGGAVPVRQREPVLPIHWVTTVLKRLKACRNGRRVPHRGGFRYRMKDGGVSAYILLYTRSSEYGRSGQLRSGSESAPVSDGAGRTRRDRGGGV